MTADVERRERELQEASKMAKAAAAKQIKGILITDMLNWKKVELCNSLFERWEETRFSIFPLGTTGEVEPFRGWRDTSDKIHT